MLTLVLSLKIFPFICEYVTRSDVLELRKVCKHWRYAVDNFLDQRNRYLSSSIYHTDQYRVSVPAEEMDHVWILHNQLTLTCKILDGLLKPHVHYTHKFFTGRSVRLSFSMTCRTRKYDKFMKHFGENLLHLKIRSTYNGVSSLLRYLVRVLKFCPNLKTLVISGASWPREPEPEDQMSEVEIIEDYARTLERVWPQQLECITFRLKGEYEDILKSVCLSIFCPHQNWFNMIRPTEFYKNMAEKVCQLTFVLKSNTALESMLKLDIPVTILNLDFTYDADGSEMYVLLVNVINRLRDSLTSLRIAFMTDFAPFSESSSDFDVPVLDMPKLKVLTMKWPSVHVSLNPFSKLKSLEYLTIYYHHHDETPPENVEKALKDTEEHEVLDIRRLLIKQMQFPYHEPYFSNMWSILPKLREFKFVVSSTNNALPVERLYRKDAHETHDKNCTFESCKALINKK